MSNLKISRDQHLESQELNRFKKFLASDGYEKLFGQIFSEYGIANVQSAATWENFRITTGTTAGTIKVKDGVGVDKNLKILSKTEEDNIVIPVVSTDYYVKASYRSVNYEVGTCSIDSDGNITGSGTAFTEVIRGIPNIYSVVKFVKASDESAANNSGEYVVQSVDSDTAITLQSDIISGQSFQAESDLKIVVVGSFTPGATIDSGDKNIYEYDSCEIVLDLTDSVTTGEQFLLAKVSKDGSNNVTIEDLRTRNELKTNSIDILSTHYTDNIDSIIGIESIKFDRAASSRTENIIRIGWGIRVNSWTVSDIEESLRLASLVVLSDNIGGKIKDIRDIPADYLIGWRLYAPDGKFYYINDNTPTLASQDIYLKNIDLSSFSDETQPLYIVPDVDFITISCEPSLSAPNNDVGISGINVTFPIEKAFADIRLYLYDTNVDPTYDIFYRLKNNLYNGPLFDLPADVTNGYYAEDTFDENGEYDSGSRTTYVNNTITLQIPINAGDFVRKSGDSMSGNLDMSDSAKVINLPNGSSAGDAVNKSQLDGKVNNTGNETIGGVKTFSSAPVMSSGITQNGVTVNTKVIDVFDWDMDTQVSKQVDSGLSVGSNVLSINGFVYRDSGVDVIAPIPYLNPITNDIELAVSAIDFDTLGAPVILVRKSGGALDSSSFSQTGGYLRARLIIQYL